jgi:uncharacterized membrane protein YtjA (UPF0391 family)
MWTAAGAVAGTMGFTGIMDATAGITQGVFFGCAIMAVLSLLFCLFEDDANHSVNH